MARPYKQGVDYYSLDVDFLKDIKYRKIRRSCGSQTCEILLCLLGYIYGDMGYFLRWDEDSAFLVADDVGAKEGLVEEVVSKAIQVGFFNREKYEKYQILTSNGIQKRYKLITRKRKEVSIKKEYLVNDDNNLVNGGNNSTSTVVNGVRNTQIEREIEKESKVNEIKDYEEDMGVYEFIQKSWGKPPTGLLQGALGPWIREWGSEMILFAFQSAYENSVEMQGLKKYVDKILATWKSNNVSTLQEAVQAKEDWEAKKSKRTFSNSQPSRNVTRKEPIPKWLADYEEQERLRKEREAHRYDDVPF
ncbi:Lin1244/Lin1753 domain-containing protein [uncultured Enterococcus sp.]|uniref:Lin1244/Lin1753 domain-containing protein n=1 Tax=uncultured Enterococcus sp. TaxID=167972 RepID=UPI00258B1B35|nr:Lin1244/Lin1753 domain-containing protein [uncultured Enterococcus sp.]